MKESDASLLVVGLFSIYEHKAKPTTETKRSVVEVGHGGVARSARGRIYSHLGFFYAYLSGDCRERENAKHFRAWLVAKNIVTNAYFIIIDKVGILY